MPVFRIQRVWYVRAESMEQATEYTKCQRPCDSVDIHEYSKDALENMTMLCLKGKTDSKVEAM